MTGPVTAFYGVIGGAAAAGLVWLGFQARRVSAAPRLAALLGVIAFYALSWPFGVAANAHLTAAQIPPGYWFDTLDARTAEHVLRLAATYCLLLFILATPVTPDPRPLRRPARSQLLVLLLAVAAMVLNTALVPAALRDQLADLANGTTATAGPIGATNVALFFLIENLYYVLVFIVAARWAGGHLGRKLPAALRAGLVLVAAGSTGLVIATLALVVSVLIRWSGHRPPTWIDIVGLTLLAAGLLVVIVGLILPSALRGPASLRLRRRRRRVYRELEPLWAQLTEAFPQQPPTAALDEHSDPDHRPDAEGGPNQRGAGRRDLPTLPTVGFTRRYYRRIIECRDCLIQLSPYLHLVTEGHLDPTGLPSGADLAAALAARTARVDPDRPVESVIGPAHTGDADADADILAELAHRLSAAQRGDGPGRPTPPWPRVQDSPARRGTT